VVVNYDPDSAGMAATERSLALLLEGGFEAKVLALPGGLDPDAFIRKQGAAAYRDLLAGAPAYLDYLTERAAATHDLRTPEGKVAAANAVMPFLVKVPNPLLRAELAGRLAERLRLDERLLRGELQRAAGAGRVEVRVSEEVAGAQANHAVKQLLRLCLESPGIAEAVLPALLETGAAQGLVGEGIFTRLWEAHQRGEKLDVTGTEVNLSEAERKLVFDALFWPGDSPNLEVARGALRSLQSDKLERELHGVQVEIERALREGDPAQVTQLNITKLKLRKELGAISRTQKNSPAG